MHRGKNDLDEAQVTDVDNYRYASGSCVLYLIILVVFIIVMKLKNFYSIEFFLLLDAEYLLLLGT